MSPGSKSAATTKPQPTQKHIIKEVHGITSDGFFGLDELHKFFMKEVEPVASQETSADGAILLDFSAVETWDIAALLWLVVALDYYSEDRDLSLVLRLPEKGTASADFLLRWDFFGALKNLHNDPKELLVYDQVGYFDQDRQTLSGFTQDEPDELLRYLLSQDLVRIRNLADVRKPKKLRTISSWLTAQCRNVFIESGLGFFLHERCKIPKPEANLFAKEIANEGILNVQEHPNASIGMASISVSRDTDTLILAIADNGDSIPETIYGHYLWYQRHLDHPGAKGLPSTYSRRIFSRDQRADIVNYATQAGTSRKHMTPHVTAGYDKWLKEMDNIGMGLYYVRNDTTQVFQGELLVAADGISVVFNKPIDENGNDVGSQCSSYGFPWRGNLLRISIPLHSQCSE